MNSVIGTLIGTKVIRVIGYSELMHTFKLYEHI